MIFYFSGTGNSRYVAEQLATLLNDRIVAVAEAMAKEELSYTLTAEESIGMVFPTYSWGPAPIMLDFISKMQVSGYTKSTYCYMVTTCGDDIGESVDIWQKSLPQGLIGNAAFSVQMPNNYILLPGFDVDSKELEKAKIKNSISRIAQVADCISAHKETIDVVQGNWKWIKSRVILPLFWKYAMSDKPFHIEASWCTSCGLCVRSCPVKNITTDDAGHPVWNHNCKMCLSCIHRCPTRAINYGKMTRKKGRYHFKQRP